MNLLKKRLKKWKNTVCSKHKEAENKKSASFFALNFREYKSSVFCTQLSRIYGEKILGDNQFLMEIKANGVMPLWLADLLSDLEIYPLSFSKYGNIYESGLTHSKMESN